MKNNILKISLVLFVMMVAVFNTTLTNKSHNLSDFLLSNIEALAQNESNSNSSEKGSHVIDGSCTVTVNNRNYNGTWNKCDTSDESSCHSVCVTAIM